MVAPVLSLASFFTIEAREYSNFTFSEGARTTVQTVIYAFCIGILIATLYSLYQSRVPGAIVRAFLRAEAFSPETAKSPEELELVKNPLFRFELWHNATLRRFLLPVTEDAEAAKEAEAAEKAEAAEEADNAEDNEQPTRYYIPEELKYRAELRYEKRGSALWSLILTVVLTLGISILLIKLTPVVLSVVDKLLK